MADKPLLRCRRKGVVKVHHLICILHPKLCITNLTMHRVHSFLDKFGRMLPAVCLSLTLSKLDLAFYRCLLRCIAYPEFQTKLCQSQHNLMQKLKARHKSACYAWQRQGSQEHRPAIHCEHSSILGRVELMSLAIDAYCCQATRTAQDRV